MKKTPGAFTILSHFLLHCDLNYDLVFSGGNNSSCHLQLKRHKPEAVDREKRFERW